MVVTHPLQVERGTGKVRRPEIDVLPLCHATHYTTTAVYTGSQTIFCASYSASADHYARLQIIFIYLLTYNHALPLIYTGTPKPQDRTVSSASGRGIIPIVNKKMLREMGFGSCPPLDFWQMLRVAYRAKNITASKTQTKSPFVHSPEALCKPAYKIRA